MRIGVSLSILVRAVDVMPSLLIRRARSAYQTFPVEEQSPLKQLHRTILPTEASCAVPDGSGWPSGSEHTPVSGTSSATCRAASQSPALAAGFAQPANVEDLQGGTGKRRSPRMVDMVAEAGMQMVLLIGSDRADRAAHIIQGDRHRLVRSAPAPPRRSSAGATAARSVRRPRARAVAAGRRLRPAKAAAVAMPI